MIDQIEAFEIHNNTNSMSDQYYAKVAEGYTTAMTPQTDDPDIPALTFRSIFLGTIWAIFLASSNILFSFRTNWFQVPTGLAQLLSYPMGIFLAAVLPKGILNPGPFSIKEHVLIFIIAGSAGGQPYGVDNVITQHANFLMGDPEVNLWNSFAWVAGSQLVGYGVAGICRRFLVKPVSMLWPTVLPNVALFTTLNNVETLADKRSPGLSRSVFFWATFAAIFIWTWLPNYFVSVFGTISVLCFITTNRTARFLGSATSGIGLGAISLDWGNISSYSPIAIPWFATVNYLVGTITWQWIVVPICYYSNIWGRLAPAPSSAEYSDGTPFGILNVPYIYSSNGTRMRVSRPNITSPAANDYTRLLDQEFKLDMAKYEAFKPFVLTEFFAISYFCSFMNIAAIFSHVALWHGSDLVGQTKSAFKQISTDGGLEDVHNRLMRAYRDIPEWMYATWLVAFTLIQIAVCQWTPFHMPWWASIMAIAMGVFSSIPIGIVQAITGTQIGLNVITEFVIGLILPGDARAVITFKSLGYNIVIQALNLVSDLKIGHYMHISPIAMVVCQLLGTLIGILFNTGGAFYILDIMTSPQVFHDPLWNGVGHQTFLNAAGIYFLM